MAYYHFSIEWIDRKSNFYKHGTREDLSIEQLMIFVDPIKNGLPMLFYGWRINPDDIEHFAIWKTDGREQEKPKSSWKWITDHGENVTNEFLATLQLEPSHEAKGDKTRPAFPKETQYPLSKDVFIVHGRDHKPMKELKTMLKEFGLKPVILHEQPSGSRTIVEKLEKHSNVGYAFVLLTPDDIGGERSKYDTKTLRIADDVLTRARQNVILEFGYFIGRLGRDRVACFHKGKVELPSDMQGIVYIPFKESVKEARDMITKELKEAGYEIEM